MKQCIALFYQTNKCANYQAMLSSRSYDPNSGSFLLQQPLPKVSDEQPSLAFDFIVLGLMILQKAYFPMIKFSLYFSAYEDKMSFPKIK